jgi:hypothetical protein
VFRCAVVESQIVADRTPRLCHAVIGAQINLFVFDRAPQPFNEHVVAPGTAAIHADPDQVVRQQASERYAGELAALVGIEDPRTAMSGERLIDCVQAEIHLQRDRRPPGQYSPAEPVHHRREVDKAASHRNVCDIHRPNLVRSLYLHATQQVWKNLVSFCGF